MNSIKPNNNYIYNKKIQGKILPKTSKLQTKNVSFKGVENVLAKEATTLITQSDRKIIDIFSKNYGNIAERLGKKVAKLTTGSELLKKSSRFSLEKGITSIKEKKIGQSLAENILFPFINLPLYFASWVLKKLKSIPALKDSSIKLYNKPLFRIPRKFNELDSKTDSLKGIYEKTSQIISDYAKKKNLSFDKVIEYINNKDDGSKEAQKIAKEANEYIKENLYRVSNKFFDKHTGNYNTAYERPLNRIVSGLIPATFLANDAYNLAVLCGDSKEDSKKEANERKKQEISRVFTTAYMQLLTFGAFTKQVNTIPWFTPLTSALTVLLSETTSRKRLGKPIFFLSKDKAKEYNKRNKDSKDKSDIKSNFKGKENLVKEENITDKTDYKLLKTDTPNIFTSFKSLNNNTTSKSFGNNKPESKEKVNEPKKEDTKKAIINAKTFKNAIIILITGGFALSFLKNSSFTKNTKFMQAINNFKTFCKNKLYNPIAYKDFEISKGEFDKIMSSLKEAGCKEIAEGHEFIKNKYGKETADGIIKMYQSKLSSSKATEAINNIAKNFEFKAENNVVIEEFKSSIKVAIEQNKTLISENKFEDIAQKATEIMQKKGMKFDENTLKSLTQEIGNELSKNAQQSAIQVDRKLKPFVDIVTEPFKFIASAANLPFKITSSFIKILLSPIEKKAAKAMVGEAQLNNLEKGIHRAVTEIFGPQKAKQGHINQVIFANAMEQFSKKTMPFRKAQEALEKAKNSNVSKEELSKIISNFNKEKENLLKYVNNAVEKSFNGVTQSGNKNTDLAMMSKLASSAVTSAFLVADNYNMVMIKSNGEDKENAKETANERIIQRLSALFYQTLFINWFNATFRSTYNSSLKGMTAVVIPNTITTEILTRKSIGMPIRRKTLEQLEANEEKNDNRKGFLGKYFKFMRLLTGKKPLKDRIQKNKPDKNIVNSNNKETTNLLEKYSK